MKDMEKNFTQQIEKMKAQHAKEKKLASIASKKAVEKVSSSVNQICSCFSYFVFLIKLVRFLLFGVVLLECEEPFNVYFVLYFEPQLQVIRKFNLDFFRQFLA